MEDQEGETGLEIRYKEVYKKLESASDGESYAKAMLELAKVMQDEVMQDHVQGKGPEDVHQTFKGWSFELRKNLPTLQESIKNGQNFSFNVNTISKGKPHGEGAMLVSESLAETLVGWVESRGRGFISAKTVGGNYSDATVPESPYRAQTTVSGFKSKE